MKYTVIIHCVYEGPVEERYEKCIIRPTTYDDTEHDGMNFVSGAGRETYDFYIVDGLEEAILSTHFNPAAIEFMDLDEDENAQKNEIIAKYGWDPAKGVYTKVFLQENKEFDKMVEFVNNIDDNAFIHKTRQGNYVAVADSEKIAIELLKHYHPKITLEKMYNTIIYRILALNFETDNKDYDEGFFDCQKEILKRIDVVAKEFGINVEIKE